LFLFLYQNRKKLNKRLSVSIALFGLFLILFWSFAYHDACEFVPGFDSRGGDVLYDKSSLCLNDKAIATQNINLCLKASGYLGDYCIIEVAKLKQDYRLCENVRDKKVVIAECYMDVAVFLKDETICNEITEWEYKRNKCYSEVSAKLTIIDDALKLLSSNITVAVEKCQEFSSLENQRSCYGNLSDRLSGLTYIYRFNPSQQIVNLCLNSPNQKEWLLCIHGYAFDGFTASNLVSSFKEKVRSDPYKVQTFCDAYDYRFGNGGVYGPATELFNEVCK
jgi:hypothetical protein